jgi:peptidoglycan/LPS O-acetylase OafA/YrhL
LKFIPIVNHSLKYNPSLDGLRGVAITLVLLFHIWPDTFSFGYMGVDIFFVLSGFLITQIIYTKLENDTFSFKEFYRNRVRRIFPAMIVVLLVAFFIGYLFMFPSELKSLGQHMKTSVLFWQNFRLMEEVGYWDKAAELKPLLHFWSLSIEEQFYIFWPIILVLIYKFRINFLISIGVLFILLTVLSQILDINKFYHSFARFWELAFGSFLFVLSQKFDYKYHVNKFKLVIFLVFITSLLLAFDREFNFFPQ